MLSRHTLRPLVFAALSSTLLVGMIAAPALAKDSATVEISDECDPVTFSQQTPPVPCDPKAGGDVKFLTLINAILEDPRGVLADREVEGWEFSEDDLTVRAGSTIRLRNVGGELHTFSNVGAHFTQGCVPPVNALFGNLLPPADPAVCAAFNANPFAVGGVAPLTRTSVTAPATAGHYKFQCLIHPWMRTDVTVR